MASARQTSETPVGQRGRTQTNENGSWQKARDGLQVSRASWEGFLGSDHPSWAHSQSSSQRNNRHAFDDDDNARRSFTRRSTNTGDIQSDSRSCGQAISRGVLEYDSGSVESTSVSSRSRSSSFSASSGGTDEDPYASTEEDSEHSGPWDEMAPSKETPPVKNGPFEERDPAGPIGKKEKKKQAKTSTACPGKGEKRVKKAESCPGERAKEGQKVEGARKPWEERKKTGAKRPPQIILATDPQNATQGGGGAQKICADDRRRDATEHRKHGGPHRIAAGKERQKKGGEGPQKVQKAADPRDERDHRMHGGAKQKGTAAEERRKKVAAEFEVPKKLFEDLVQKGGGAHASPDATRPRKMSPCEEMQKEHAQVTEHVKQDNAKKREAEEAARNDKREAAEKEAAARNLELASANRAPRAKQAASVFTTYAGKNQIDGVAVDSHDNAIGTEFDLGRNVTFDELSLVILQECDEFSNHEFSLAKCALMWIGFKVKMHQGIMPTLQTLNCQLEQASQVWLIATYHAKLSDAHIDLIAQQWRKGLGVYIWGDREPFFIDANRLLSAMFPGDEDLRLSGNQQGGRTVGPHPQEGGVGGITRHLVTTGLVKLYEGKTVSHFPRPTAALAAGFEPILYEHGGCLVSAARQAQNGCGPVIVDGGFTRLMTSNWKGIGHGTHQFVRNCACWLSTFGVQDNVWIGHETDPGACVGFRQAAEAYDDAETKEVCQNGAGQNVRDVWQGSGASSFDICKLYLQAEATLNSQNVQASVQLPDGAEEDTWIAAQLLAIMKDLDWLIISLKAHCSRRTCPQMCAGQCFIYKWADEGALGPVAIAAKDYMQKLSKDADWRFADEELIQRAGVVLPAEFRDEVSLFLKRVFHCYAHAYIHHFEGIQGDGAETCLNFAFKRFLHLVREFNLVADHDMQPLKCLIDKFMKADDARRNRGSRRATQN